MIINKILASPSLKEKYEELTYDQPELTLPYEYKRLLKIFE